MLVTASKAWGRFSFPVAAVWLLACNPPPKAELLSYERALEISREAAERNGYDLSEYTLDTFGDASAGGNDKWLIVYNCAPEPPAPGCHFMVVVDRQTGRAELHQGE